MEIRNAVIESAVIDDADRGFLNAWVHLDYGGSGQGFGGYCLYVPKGFKYHNINSIAGHFIWRCMEVAGVTKWGDMKGKTVRARIGGNNTVEAIGHIVKDDWFCPKEDFAHEQDDQP